mmetsp:Transcript_41560/g.88566  ORF Transcript_41560/g.88566 Transcript_41560/m.88566 type:complete len:536 (+) Transcript_41560:98-1705(+)
MLGGGQSLIDFGDEVVGKVARVSERVEPKMLCSKEALKLPDVARRAQLKRMLLSPTNTKLMARVALNWQTVNSTFSALNIDVAPSLGGRSPTSHIRCCTVKSPSSMTARSDRAGQTVAATCQQQEQVPPDFCLASDASEPLVKDCSIPSSSTGLELSRSFLLRFCSLENDTIPDELRSLVVAQVMVSPTPEMPTSPTDSGYTSPAGNMGKLAPIAEHEATSARVSRVQHHGHKLEATPEEEMRRAAQALLNKICPENVATIAKKMSQIKVRTSLQLESLIDLIFRKALAEPHYCETYADLIFSLKSEFPEFPSPNEGEGAKPVSFRSSVLNICQNEFERTLFPPEEQSEDAAAEEGCGDAREKARMLANMKFIGHLFLRQLLSAKVIGSVIQELTLCDQVDKLPQEHAVECACELLLNIGFTLESMAAGSQTLSQVCGRLLELKQRKTPEGRGAYSKRIQFTIQNLLDTRAARWHQKTFRSRAKTMEEIRLEQTQQLAAQARGAELESGEQVVAGQRPQYMAAVAASPLQRKPTL